MEISQARPSEALASHSAGPDERLATEARTSSTAFGLLYERHVGRVFACLRALGATEELAADLTATTFERALQHIHRYRTNEAGVAPWLLQIARNAYYDSIRRRRPTVAIERASRVATSDLTPEDAAIAAEERRSIRGLVATLPRLQQEALALRFAAGLSIREVAVVIGKSDEATKKLISRALAVLKERSCR